MNARVVVCKPGAPCHGNACESCDPDGWLAAHDEATQLLDGYPLADPVPEDWAQANIQERQVEDRPAPYLEWASFMAEDFSTIEFLAGDIVLPGSQTALVGDGKVGKSLFALEWAHAISTGRAFLGGIPRPPKRVLYVDFENGWPDIQQRIKSLGFMPGDLGGLSYLSFPPMPPLDTAEGGQYLMSRIEESDSEVVFLDTISRMIQGKESDSDTWLDVYRKTMVRLKSAGIASIRLDHFGKDAAKGARGSSAKTQDIDGVWEMSTDGRPATTGVPIKLVRTHTRNGLGRGRVDLCRTGRTERFGKSERWAPGETSHVVRAATAGAEPEFLIAEHLAALADKAGVAPSAGRDALKAALPDQKHGNTVWTEAARIRKCR